MTKTELTEGAHRVLYPQRLLLIVGVTLFTLYFGAYQIAMHRAGYTGVDLANVNQVLWTTLHGEFMRSTVYPPTGEYVGDFADRITESRLGTHVQPFFLVLLLPYALQGSESLMVLLSLTLGLGAIPVFRIASRRFGSDWAGLVFAWLYLLLPAVQTNAAWDVHLVSFVPALLLAAVDAAQQRKLVWWWLWALLAMGCREDIPFLVGWTMLWISPRTQRKTAWRMFGVGFALSLLSFAVLIPRFGGGEGTPFLAFLFPSGTSITARGIAPVLLTPEYWMSQVSHFLEYSVLLGLPFLFFCYINLPGLLALMPMLLLNGLSWHQPVRLPYYSHYSALAVAVAMIAAIEGFFVVEKWLRRRKPQIKWRMLSLVSLLMTAALVTWAQGYTPLSQGFVWPDSLRSRSDYANVVSAIPKGATLSTGLHLAPQLAERSTFRFFPDLRGVDWVAVDVWNWADPYGPGLQVWRELLEDRSWETAAARDGIVVLRRGDGPPTGLAGAFQPEAHRLRSLDVRFGFDTVLSGAQVFPLPLGHFILCTDWRTDAGSEVKPVVTTGSNVRPLDTYLLLPDLYATSGQVRDCTQLQAPVSGQTVLLNLSILSENGETLQPTIESALDWDGRVAVDGTSLRLEFDR